MSNEQVNDGKALAECAKPSQLELSKQKQKDLTLPLSVVIDEPLFFREYNRKVDVQC